MNLTRRESAIKGGESGPAIVAGSPEKSLPFEFTTTKRAGYDWWSLQPVQRPAPPRVELAAWVRGPIDQFVLAQLESAKLKPAPDADKLTLLRRATFDLVGLPPTPDEIDAFLADSSADAYERLIDRLLDSPHYGERCSTAWASWFCFEFLASDIGVRPNSVVPTDDVGYRVAEQQVTVYDLHATILHLLGLDHTRLTFYHNGAERRLTDVHGQVIRPILA